jgi:hypothetical protein
MVNILFYDMYCKDTSPVLVYFVLGNFDFRKKLRLMKDGFQRQKIKDPERHMSRMQSLMDIRNAIAHGPFYEEPAYEGLFFDDYVDKNSGKQRLPHKRDGKPERSDENRLITFSEFDQFDKQLADIYEYLTDLEGTLMPITELNDEFESELAEVMGLP